MERDDLVEYFDQVIKHARKILENKNHDYAGGGDVFANFTRVESLGITSTEKGMLVRMSDKLSRLSSFCEQGKLKVDESVEDTCVDLINYAFLLLAYLHSKSANLPKVSVADESDSKGVIYFATGFKDNGRMPILEEVIQSAESLKRHSPDIPITVFTDEPVDREDLFDNVLPLVESIDTRLDAGSSLIEMSERCQLYREKWMVFCGWKLHLATLSPYEKTLYLDSDTLILNPIDSLFDTPHEFAAAKDADAPRIPFNGGMFFFNSAGRDFMRVWADHWFDMAAEGNLFLDQDAELKSFDLYEIKYKRPLDFALLDYKVWNVRPNLANDMPLEERPKVNILHSRFHILDEAETWIVTENFGVELNVGQ
jgi:hypothetical protein